MFYCRKQYPVTVESNKYSHLKLIMNFKKRFIFKFISSALVGIFAFQQIVWSQGTSPLIEKPIKTPDQILNKSIASENIKLPYELVQKNEVHFTEKEDELVIHLQDAHASLSAQYSLVELLDVLVSDYDLNFIALEGAEGAINTSVLSTFPEEDVKKETAALLMREGRLGAAEFFDITRNNEKVALYGIEDSKLYNQNLNSFCVVMDRQNESLSNINALIEQISRIEEKAYSKDLFSFLSKERQHRDKNLSFKEYWEDLNRFVDRFHLDLNRYVNIRKLNRSIDLEKNIDFRMANEERRILINRLSEETDKKGLEDLVLKSLEFKEKKVSASNFYKYLKDMAERCKLDLDEYNDLIRFSEYMAIYESVDIFQLYLEIDLLQDSIRDKLYINDQERDLYEISTMLIMLKKLYKIEMTNTDYYYTKKYLSKYNAGDISCLIRDKCREYDIPIDSGYDVGKVFLYTEEALNFYEVAADRDRVMLANTLSRMKKEGKKIAALITGGYHTKGLTELMRDKGLSYMVIVPKFEAGKERPYIAVLTGKTNPYKKLLESGKYNIAVGAYFASENFDTDRLIRTVAKTAAVSVLMSKRDWDKNVELWGREYARQFDIFMSGREGDEGGKETTRPSPAGFLEILDSLEVRRKGDVAVVVYSGNIVMALERRENGIYEEAESITDEHREIARVDGKDKLLLMKSDILLGGIEHILTGDEQGAVIDALSSDFDDFIYDLIRKYGDKAVDRGNIEKALRAKGIKADWKDDDKLTDTVELFISHITDDLVFLGDKSDEVNRINRRMRTEEYGKFGNLLLSGKPDIKRRENFGLINGEWELMEGDGVTLLMELTSAEDLEEDTPILSNLIEITEGLRAIEPSKEKLDVKKEDNLHVTVEALISNTGNISADRSMDYERKRRKEVARSIAGKHGEVEIEFYYKDISMDKRGDIAVFGYMVNPELDDIREDLRDAGISAKPTNIVHISLGRIFDEKISDEKFEEYKAYIEELRKRKGAGGKPALLGRVRLSEIKIWDQRLDPAVRHGEENQDVIHLGKPVEVEKEAPPEEGSVDERDSRIAEESKDEKVYVPKDQKGGVLTELVVFLATGIGAFMLAAAGMWNAVVLGISVLVAAEVISLIPGAGGLLTKVISPSTEKRGFIVFISSLFTAFLAISSPSYSHSLGRYTETHNGQVGQPQQVVTPQSVTYEYYSISGNLKRKFDISGDITEYKDEDWHGIGFGRIILFYDASDNEYSTYDWETLESEERVLVVGYEGQYDADRGDPVYADVDNDEKRVVYEYDHNGDQINIGNGWTLRYKRQYDAGGSILRTYIYDEQERLVEEIFPDGSYKTFTDFYPEPYDEQPRFVTEFDTEGVRIAEYEYDEHGTLLAVTGQTDIYTYYPSGRMHTRELLVADDNGTPNDPSDDLLAGTVLTYSDEDIYYDADSDTWYGYLERQDDPDKSYKIFTYWDADTIKTITEYDTKGVFSKEYEFDGEGRLIKETNADNSYKTFEDFYPAPNDKQYEYMRIYDSSGVLVEEYKYDENGVLLEKQEPGVKYTYYGGTHMESKTLEVADADGNIYYHFIDEYFYDNGTSADTSDDYGRVDVIERKDPNENGEIALYIEYLQVESDKARIVHAYSDVDRMNEIFEYEYNEENILIRKVDHVDGVTFTYYADADNRIEIKTLDEPDADGNVYYHFMNEAFYEIGMDSEYGRVDIIGRDAANPNGEMAFYIKYRNENSDKARIVFAYADTGMGTLKTIYVYNRRDVLIIKIELAGKAASTGLNEDIYSELRAYMSPRGIDPGILEDAAATGKGLTITTYYPRSGNIENEWSLPADKDGFYYKHYLDEDFYDNGTPLDPEDDYGRADILKRLRPNEDGEKAFKVKYLSSSSDKARVVYSYKDLAMKDLAVTYTYYSSGNMESKTLADPDSESNIYFHYKDEKFYDNGTPNDPGDDYGRTDIITKEKGYTTHILSWYTGTDKWEKVEYFNDKAMSDWDETHWLRENGNPSRKVESSGEAAIYFDSPDWVVETYWAVDTTVTHYAGISDSRNGKPLWWIGPGTGATEMQMYQYYASGRVHYKNVYRDDGQFSDAVAGDNTWDWRRAEEYYDSGSIPWGEWKGYIEDRAQTGAPQAIAAPDKPERAHTSAVPDVVMKLMVSAPPTGPSSKDVKEVGSKLKERMIDSGSGKIIKKSIRSTFSPSGRHRKEPFLADDVSVSQISGGSDTRDIVAEKPKEGGYLHGTVIKKLLSAAALMFPWNVLASAAEGTAYNSTLFLMTSLFIVGGVAAMGVVLSKFIVLSRKGEGVVEESRDTAIHRNEPVIGYAGNYVFKRFDHLSPGEDKITVSIGIQSGIFQQLHALGYLEVWLRLFSDVDEFVMIDEQADPEKMRQEFSERTRGRKVIGGIIDNSVLGENGLMDESGHLLVKDDQESIGALAAIILDFAQKAEKDILRLKHPDISGMTYDQIISEFDSDVDLNTLKGKYKGVIAVLSRLSEDVESLGLIDKSIYDLKLDKQHQLLFMSYELTEKARDFVRSGYVDDERKYISVSARTAADMKFIANTLKDMGLDKEKASGFIQVRVESDDINESNLARYMSNTGLSKYLDVSNVVILSSGDMEEMSLGKVLDLVKSRFGADIALENIAVGDASGILREEDKLLLKGDNVPVYVRMEGYGLASQLLRAVVEIVSNDGSLPESLGEISITTEDGSTWYIYLPDVRNIDIDKLKEEIAKYNQILSAA